MVILSSLKQLMRTPVKTLFFFVLLILTTAFFILGFNLCSIADKNIQRIENMFITIGTAEQKATSLDTHRVWDAEIKDYLYRKYPAYGETVPLSALDFSGANYIREPEKRPFYCAYDPGYIVLTDPLFEAEIEQSKLIVEIQPLEDCETGEPIQARVTKVLMGYPTIEGIRIWFCNHYDKNTYKLYADSTYIVGLHMRLGHKDFDSYDEYTPWGIPWQTSTDDTAVLWDEVTDDFYETQKGKAWIEYIQTERESIRHTIPVIPTNYTKLLMAFFNGDAQIIEGRDITDEEYNNGDHVCLIQQGFAQKNGLSLGDNLPLPLVCTMWYSSSYAFGTNGEVGASIHSNSKAGSLTPFANDTYKIVGIYNVMASGAFTPYALGGNAVIIPSASVSSIDPDSIVNGVPFKDIVPMRGYSTSFQIPNGTINDFVAVWEALGIDDIELTFYDKGYSKIKAGLDDMRSMALLIFAVGAVTTFFTVILFCHLFISKQRRRTAIERSLGLSKMLCTLSMLAAVIAIVVPAFAFGSLAGNALTDIAAPSISSLKPEQAFDTTYSDWINSADNEADSATISIEIGESQGFLYGSAIIPLALLIAWAAIRGNLKAEPLKLLGEKER